MVVWCVVVRHAFEFPIKPMVIRLGALRILND